MVTTARHHPGDHYGASCEHALGPDDARGGEYEGYHRERRPAELKSGWMISGQQPQIENTTYVTSFPALAAIQQHPVEDTIFRFTKCLQNLRKELTKEVIVRCLFEPELADVVHVDGKLL